MKQVLKVIEIRKQLRKEIVSVVEATCSNGGVSHCDVSLKHDKSLVTALDLNISKLLKNYFSKHKVYKNWNFYCEEDHSELSFPAIVLDPIDGTRELVRGLGECALSLALMPSPQLSEGSGWIFNPFTGFELASDMSFIRPVTSFESPVIGLVSRSEWMKGYYNTFRADQVELIPRGSIAFKLGLLATGAGDFVYSMRPKNIWDIAAGSILLGHRGFALFDKDGQKILSLDTKTCDGPMMWAKDQVFLRIIGDLP